MPIDPKPCVHLGWGKCYPAVGIASASVAAGLCPGDTSHGEHRVVCLRCCSRYLRANSISKTETLCPA